MEYLRKKNGISHRERFIPDREGFMFFVVVSRDNRGKVINPAGSSLLCQAGKVFDIRDGECV